MDIEDRFQIQDLVSRYAFFVDSFMTREWVDVFTPDAVLDESAFGMGRYEGHDALLGYAEAIARRVEHLIHVMSNHLIWESTADTARGTCFAIVESMQKTGARARYHVKYEDEYKKIDGKWLIHRRILRTSFPPEILATAQE
jgi:hypothetical protein